MRSFPTSGDDSKPDSPIQKIINGALDIPFELSDAPNTAGNELPTHGDVGYHGSFLYINLGGTTYKLNITAV